jgi:hypothetical protein
VRTSDTLEPGGQPIEVDAPSAWTLADWQAYAARYHDPGCAVTPIAGLPTVWCRSTLSHEDMADIEAGAIHHKTLKAYAHSFAEGLRSGRLASAVAPLDRLSV